MSLQLASIFAQVHHIVAAGILALHGGCGCPGATSNATHIYIYIYIYCLIVLIMYIYIYIYGHQPGIAAHLETTTEEDDVVVESILAQKVGSSPKTLKDLKAFAAENRSGLNETVRVRVARLMTRTVIRWRRKRKHEEQPRSTEMEVELQRQNGQHMPKYSSRLIECSRCG